MKVQCCLALRTEVWNGSGWMIVRRFFRGRQFCWRFLYDANKKVIIQMKDGTPFLVISQIAQDTSMKPAEAQDIKKKIQTEKTVEKTTEGTRVQERQQSVLQS